MSYGFKTILTTATLIIDGNCARKGLTITNNGAKTIFIAPDSNLTVSTGIPLFQFSTRDQMKIPENYFGPVYGIVSTGTADARYWEMT